ncbi:MAG: hypothetical protein AAF415_15085 [Pseudomonadota bacterium]
MLALGGEGVYFLGETNLRGSLEGTCARVIRDCQIGITIGGTYFATEDLSFNLTGRYDRLLFDPLSALETIIPDNIFDLSLSSVTGTAEMTYRVSGTPLSSGLAVGITHPFGGYNRGWSVIASGSLTYHFGTETLKEESRSGPLFGRNRSAVLDFRRKNFVRESSVLARIFRRPFF